jgi:hypothetical protein
MVATRDLTRRNYLGQTVIIVPKGQPIPAGLTVDPADQAPVPSIDSGVTPDRAQLHRPEPDIGGQQQRRTHLQRLYTLAGRRQ